MCVSPVFWMLFTTLYASALPWTPSWQKHDHYSETWTAIVDTTDHTYLQIQMNITNMGPGSDRSFCRILWAPASQEPEQHVEQRTKQSWEEYPKSQGFRAASCSLTRTDTTTVLEGRIEQNMFTLTLQQPPKPVATPGSPLLDPTHNSAYSSDILIPWAHASGKLLFKNHAPYNFKGEAYLDHSRSTFKAFDLASGWVRFRGFKPGCETLFLTRFPPGSTEASNGYLWDKNTPSPTGPNSFQTAHFPPKAPLGQPLVFTDADTAHTWVFRAQQKIYTHEPLGDYGVLRRIIGHYIGDAETTTYRAVLQRSAPPSTACTHVPGILEISTVRR